MASAHFPRKSHPFHALTLSSVLMLARRGRGWGAAEEDSAILRIYSSSFYVVDGAYNASKTFNLEYSDRFSAVDEATKERKVRTMSAGLRKDKITGSTGETWVIRDVDGDVMTVDYDSGKKEGEVWRRCRFVFRKVADTVVRE